MSIDSSFPSESSTKHHTSFLASSLPSSSSFCATFASPPLSPNLHASASTTTAGTDEFGWSVATNCDGSQILVGAAKDPTVVHLFGDDTTFRNPSNSFSNSNKHNNVLKTFHNPQWYYDTTKSKFGAAVAMNANGQRLLIGDPYTKVVYLYDEHGHLMHTFHDPTDNDATTGANGIYAIFQSATSSGKSEDNVVETLFGASIDVSDDGSVVVIGAEGVAPTDPETVRATGAVYVYTHSPEKEWTVQSVVDPIYNVNHRFGVSVALNRNGTRLVVGARSSGITDGSVYLYELVNAPPIIDDDDDFVHDYNVDGSNTADVYHLKQRFVSPSGASSQWFGGAVDITDEYVVVGARGDAVEQQYQSGAVYLFDVESGQLIDTITQPSGPMKQGEFGASVAMKGDRIVVTSSFDGTAYAYEMVHRTSLDDGGPSSNRLKPHAVLVGKYPIPTNPGNAGGTVALSGDGKLGFVGAPQALGKSGYVKGAVFAICFPEISDSNNGMGYSSNNTTYTCPNLHLPPLPWSTMGYWDWDSMSGRILWLTLAIIVSLFIFQYRPKRQPPPQEQQRRRRPSFGRVRRQQQRSEFQRLTTISEIELVEEMILT